MTDTGRDDMGPMPADALLREQRLQRNLKILVGFLSCLILGGLAAVVIRVLTLSPPPAGSRPQAAIASVAPLGEIALELPAGARIVSVSASDGRLVVHHESPAGARIAVLDLATGALIYDLKPVEAAPKN